MTCNLRVHTQRGWGERERFSIFSSAVSHEHSDFAGPGELDQKANISHSPLPSDAKMSAVAQILLLLLLLFIEIIDRRRKKSGTEGCLVDGTRISPAAEGSASDSWSYQPEKANQVLCSCTFTHPVMCKH